MFLGTARTSVECLKTSGWLASVDCFRSDREEVEKGYVLFSGICTTNSFLHSLGLLICAGTNGYCYKGNV
jgi:hypothetical protein